MFASHIILLLRACKEYIDQDASMRATAIESALRAQSPICSDEAEGSLTGDDDTGPETRLSRFMRAAGQIANIKDTYKMTGGLPAGLPPPDPKIALDLYGLYKHIYQGECCPETHPPPSRLNIFAHSKWKAWHNQRGLSQSEAMDRYIQLASLVLRRPL